MTSVYRFSHYFTQSFFILAFFLILPTPQVFSQTATTSEETDVTAESTFANPYSSEILENDGRVIGDFVVGPGKVELSLKPGESKTVELLVTNRTGEAKIFTVEFEDMTGGSNQDQALVLLGNDRGPYTLRDYLSVPKRSFELKHMERARVPVTISIPADAEPGGRYGSVLFSITSRKVDEELDAGTHSASAIISRIGTLFFVTVEGDIDREGKTVDFSTLNNRFWFSSGPVPFQIVFENYGSQHLNPYGYISIDNIFGEEVGYVEIDPWFVLPQAIRARDIQFPREFMFGYYTAHLQLNRGYDNVVDTKELSFVVIPWKFLAALFGGLMVVLLLARLFFNRFEFKRK